MGPEITETHVKNETRRPVLVRMAKELGFEIAPGENITQIKEKIMPSVVAPKKAAAPAPAKPAAAPPKPAVAAAPKPAAPAAPKPAAPGKPAAAAPPKPAAPGKPAAPAAAPAKPAAPAAPKASAAPAAAAPKAGPAVVYVLKSEFDEFVKEVREGFDVMTATIEDQAARLDGYEVKKAGGAPHVIVHDDGSMELDIANADAATLQEWASTWAAVNKKGEAAFVADPSADAEAIRAAFTAAKAAKTWAGWQYQEPAAAAEGGETEAAPEEDGVITEEQIGAMQLGDLKALATQMSLDVSDIATQPKVMRARIIEALRAMQAGAADPAEGAVEGGDSPELEVGADVIVTAEGSEYPATFQGMDADGDVLVQYSDGTTAAVPGDMISIPA